MLELTRRRQGLISILQERRAARNNDPTANKNLSFGENA